MCSPARFTPVIGVTPTAPQNATSIFGDPAGAHYRMSTGHSSPALAHNAPQKA